MRRRLSERTRSSRWLLSAWMALLGLVACTHPTVGAVPVPASPSPKVSPIVASPIPAPSPSASPTLGPPVHDITGRLHVVGTALADEHGNAVRLISILVPGLNRGSGAADTIGRGCPGWKVPPADAFRDIPRFGFNSVRLGISWANLEPSPPTKDASGHLVHHYNIPYLRAVDATVRRFAANGVAVVLDMVQVRWSPAFERIQLPRGNVYKCGVGLPEWLYPNGGGVTEMIRAEEAFFAHPSSWAGLTAVWTFLARHYADQPMVVGADILNEPYDLLAVPYPGTQTLTPAALDLTRFYRTVGMAIHGVDPSLLLVYEDKRLGGVGAGMALTGSPGLPNGVYSVHMYPDAWTDPSGRALLESYATRAAAWDAPLWIGEFSAFGYTSPTGPSPNWSADLGAFVRYCRARDIGWTIASYSGNRLLIKGTTTPKPDIVGVLRSGL